MTEYERTKQLLAEARMKRLAKYAEVISPLDAEIVYLENKSVEVCQHDDIRSHVYHYEEAGRVQRFEWNQWGM